MGTVCDCCFYQSRRSRFVPVEGPAEKDDEETTEEEEVENEDEL